MKKAITLLLVMLLIVSMLTGCGGSGSKEKVKLAILPTAYTEEDYAIAVKKGNTELLNKINGALEELIADGTAGKIIAKYIEGAECDVEIQKDVAADAPVLTMCTNAEFPPYEFHEGESIVGIDAEIAGAIADKLGMRLEIQDIAFESTIPAVVSGKADMVMAGMTVTEDRKKNVDFTTSYAKGVQAVVVPEGSKITSVDDLFEGGYVVGVQSGTTGDLYTTWDLEDEGLAEVQRYPKGADAIQALVTGKVDCVVIDNEPAKSYVASNNG